MEHPEDAIKRRRRRRWGTVEPENDFKKDKSLLPKGRANWVCHYSPDKVLRLILGLPLLTHLPHLPT